MEKNTFYTALSHPFTLSEIERKGFDRLVQDCPYFQIAQIIRLQNTFGEEKYESTLYQSGIYIPDARHYYQNLMLNKMYVQVEQEVLEEQVKEPLLQIEEQEKTDRSEELEEKNQVKNFAKEQEKEVEELQYAPTFYKIEEKEFAPQVANETHNFTDWLAALETPKSSQKTPKAKATAETISSFMSREKKPKKRTNEEVVKTTPEDSVQTPEQLMSQTLAEIYVKQKLYDRALAIYEKLDLNSSEKNTTFARRIKEIKKLKNS